jgi:hypothetical protein
MLEDNVYGMELGKYLWIWMLRIKSHGRRILDKEFISMRVLTCNIGNCIFARNSRELIYDILKS